MDRLMRKYYLFYNKIINEYLNEIGIDTNSPEARKHSIALTKLIWKAIRPENE